MKKQIQKNKEKEHINQLNKIRKTVNEVRQKITDTYLVESLFSKDYSEDNRLSSDKYLYINGKTLNVIFEKFLDYPIPSIRNQFFKHLEYIYNRDFLSQDQGFKKFEDKDSYIKYMSNFIDFFSVISLRYINEVFK